MTSNPSPTTKPDRKVALDYVRGKITRAEVNRRYGVPQGSLAGLHRVARALRDLHAEGKISTAELVDGPRLPRVQ